MWFDSYSTECPTLQNDQGSGAGREIYPYAAEDDLALRAEPSVSGYLWKRMVMGTELICLEPKATAKTKVGVNNQWINVQDPNGDQGYVAAWYVSEAKGQPAAIQ